MTQQPPRSSNTPSTILVVEDDQAILEVVKIVLADKGYKIVTASDIEILKKRVNEPPPDLILLDIWLGKDDSAEIAKKFQSGNGKKIPIIVMSADPSVESISKKIGADGFLPKPFGIDDLASVIKKYV